MVKTDRARLAKAAKTGTAFTAKEKKELAARMAKAREATRKYHEAQKETAARELREAAPKIEAWRAGGADFDGMSRFPVALRLRLDEGEQVIETTRGARVGLAPARLVYREYKAGRDVAGINLDGFTIRTVTAEQAKIGCHEVPMAEIERLATLLNW